MTEGRIEREWLKEGKKWTSWTKLDQLDHLPGLGYHGKERKVRCVYVRTQERTVLNSTVERSERKKDMYRGRLLDQNDEI